MLTVSNIRVKNEAVHGWYEADLRDEEFGGECIGRWHFKKPYEVDLYSEVGAMIGGINRNRDPEYANVIEAFIAHHANDL